MDTLDRMRDSLDGLSVGDAFGDQFFITPEIAERLIVEREIPIHEGRYIQMDGQSYWPYTDDTNMALSIARCLTLHRTIEQDWLAVDFAGHYDPLRGYGPAMHSYLARIRWGEDWRIAAPSLFEGQGSFGNGAAMRVAPLGAYFADDLNRVVIEAERSAVVTHSHSEAIAGAIAVAIATALAVQYRTKGIIAAPADFLNEVQSWVPESQVRDRIRKAQKFGNRTSVQHAVAVLGNGTGVSAPDTVPFSLWCAARHLDNYEEALWLTVSGL